MNEDEQVYIESVIDPLPHGNWNTYSNCSIWTQGGHKEAVKIKVNTFMAIRMLIKKRRVDPFHGTRPFN